VRPSGRPPGWLLMAAAGAAVLCCAGPTLLILAAGGVGGLVLHSGAFLAGGTGLAAAIGIGGLVWWRRRTCARRTVPAPAGSHEPPR
jgi:hypothetical protein